MPVFEHNGKKYNVQDAYIENFKSEYPDASTIMEREGKKFRVKISDYESFMQGVEADMSTNDSDIKPTLRTESPIAKKGIAQDMGYRARQEEKPEPDAFVGLNQVAKSGANPAPSYALPQGVTMPSEDRTAEVFGGRTSEANLAKARQGLQKARVDYKASPNEETAGQLVAAAQGVADEENALKEEREKGVLRSEGKLRSGVKAGWDKGASSLKRGTQYLAGEMANLVTGSSLDDKDIIDRWDEFMKLKNDQYAVASGADAEKVQYIKELENEYGSLEAAKQEIEKRSKVVSWGDKQMTRAAEVMNSYYETEGVGAWVGEMLPQMVPAAASMVVTAITKSPTAAKVVGGLGMTALTTATAGQSMKEARDYGAENWKVWAVGLGNGAIELVTEVIPYNRYTKRVVDATAKKVGKTMADAVTDSPAARGELEKLLVKANEELGGKLLGGKNVKEYLGDIAAEGLSEFSAEALQTITPMLYQNPEDYPTLWEVVKAGWEGAKGGIFMGSVLGGISKGVEYKTHDQRRKNQGYVDITEIKADSKDKLVGVAEIVGEREGNYLVMIDGKVQEVSKNRIGDIRRFDYGEFKAAENLYNYDEHYQEGYSEDPTGANAIKVVKEMQSAEQAVRYALDLADGADVDTFLNGRTSGEAAQGDEIIKDLIDQYVQAKARVEGMRDKFQEMRQAQYTEADNSIDEKSNNGMVYSTEMDGEEVFITGGNVVLNENGTVDVENSSEVLYIRRPDGSVRSVACENIPGEVTFENAENLKAARRAEIDEKWRADFDAAETISQGTDQVSGQVAAPAIQQNPNDFTLESEGEQFHVQVEDGVVKVDGEPVEWDAQTLADARAKAGIPNEEAKAESGDTLSPVEQVELSNETVQPQVAITALERIPRDKQNNPMYEQVESSLAWDGIVEEAGGNEETAMVAVNSMITDKQDALKRAEKAKAKAGVTIAEKIAAENERVANIEKAKADLAKWQEIAGVKAKRAAVQAENVAQPVAETAPVVESAPVEDNTPQSQSDSSPALVEQPTPQATNEMQPVSEEVAPTAEEIADAQAFAEASSQNTVEAYQNYLDNHPEGAYREGARAGVWMIEGINPETHGQNVDARNAANAVLARVPSSVEEELTNPVKTEDVNESTLSQTSDQVVDRYTLNSAGNSTQMQKDMEALRKSNREEYSKIQPAYELLKQAKERGLYPNELEELRAIVRGTSLEGKVDGWFTPVMAEGGNAPGNGSVLLSDEVANAEAEVNTTPTDAQKEAGNYKKGHVKIGPFNISIEQPKGSVRSGVDKDGKKWEVEMQNTYGYFRGTEGVDGDHIDVFLSNDIDGWNGRQVFVVDQRNADGSFDEHKVMLGFNDINDAEAAYMSNYKEGWQGLGAITGVSIEEFEKWISSSHRKTKAFAEYKNVKTDEAQNVSAESGVEDIQEPRSVEETIENGGENAVPEWLNKVPDDGRNFFVYVKFAGENKYQAIDLGKGETVDRLVRATMLQKEQLQALVDKLPSVLLEDAEFQIRDAKGNIYYNSGKVAAENEVAKQEDKDVAAFDKQAEIAKEREQRAGVAPRPGHLAVAIGEGNEKAVEEWKAKFDSYLQKLNADDLPTIDATIKGMQGRKKDIRTMNKDGYKDNSNYKAYDYIEKVLKKRAAELKKVSATEQPKQENKPVESEPIKDEAPVTSETIESESKQKVEKIEDVGEVLAGARKDALKVLASSFENATVKSLIELPFSKAFKKPDLKKAVESGALREEDALFYEAMFNALINSSKPKNSARHRNAVETWAEETYNSLQLIKSFVEADEAARDRAMAEALEDKFPARAEELAVIEKRKVWNARNNAEWGDKTTPNPVWVAHEVLKALGYKPGDKVEIPFGVLKANVFATGYEFYNKKGERLIMQSVPTVEEGIENIVWLSKIKRGDADTMHPMSSFFATPTKRDMGDSGRYYVLWGTVRNPRRSEFGSIEEANAFAAGHKEAVVRPIQEVVKRYGYKLIFREPITGDKFFVNDMEFETEGEAIQYLEDNYDAVNEQTNELLTKERGEAKKEVSADDLLEVAVVRGKEGWKYAVNIKGKYANNMGMPLLLREFDTREDAKAFLNESKNEVFEIYKKQQAEQKKFVFFDTGENSRIGEDYRGGRDVTAKDFMDTFGFRGVQFGNWTNQEDRQMAVNQAFDAFMDLAKLLGVSQKALSLNGELGMAFGSRGSGFGNAHYEPGEIVINLTKTRGAGSLAHEWWHALDNYFARRANVPMGMVTDSRSIDMRPELRQAYNELLKMIEKSDFYKRSKAKGDYWGRMHEVTARLMAEWVDQSLKDRGELNTFLSRGVNEERYKRMNYDVHRAVAHIKGKEALSYEEFENTPEALAGFPYPSRAELKEFGDAMRNIFETVEEQETEEGDVVLYRSSEDNEARAITYDEAVQIGNDFAKTHKGAAKKMVFSKGAAEIEQQMRDAGFTDLSIEVVLDNYKSGDLPNASYLRSSDAIMFYEYPTDEELYSALWHENAHRAMRKIYGDDLSAVEKVFNNLPRKLKERFIELLKSRDYAVEDYPKESVTHFIESVYQCGEFKDGNYEITRFFKDANRNAQDFANFVQQIINYIEYGNTKDGYAETRDNAGNNPENNGEEQIQERNASSGQDGRRTIEGTTAGKGSGVVNGETLDRQGDGPLTDREVVMESDPYSKVLGKPRYYGKKQKDYAARQRVKMADKARQVAGKLHLDVEVLESTDGLAGKKAKSKGWFDPRTGKITIVVPNHGSVEDIIETVLHEGVAHNGLRKMFGEHFDTFLDNVFNNVTPEIRKKIMERVIKNGLSKRVATEEYLASLAEKTNFENVNPSLWSKIKSFFMKMLVEVGVTLDKPMTDNELRYILWRSYKNLTNPGWFNIFGRVEDIAMQYELGAGNYADKKDEGDMAAENGLRFREAPGSAMKEYNNAVKRPNKSGSVSIFENVPHLLMEAYQDSMLALKTLQEAISAETGKTVADNENAYMAENRMSSTNKAMVEVYARDFMAPLMGEIDSLLKSGATMEEITNYLFAKHGIERNAYMRRKQAEEAALKDLGEAPTEMEAREAYDENLKELTDAYVKKFAKRDYSGLTALTETGNAVDAEEGAQDLVDEFERLHNTKPLWKAINNATKETLRMNFASGLIDRSTYDDVRTMFDYYIPLRGWDETVAADEFEYLTSNRPMLSPTLKSMYGRRSLADNPIATIGHMAESAIVQGNRNLMKQKFLNFVQNNPTSLATVNEQWYVLDNTTNEWMPNNPSIPLDATPEQTAQIVEEHEARMLEMEREGTATRKRSGLKLGLRTSKAEGHEHTVIVKRNGKEYCIYINGNPRAAQAVNGLTNPETISGFGAEAAQAVKNFMSRAFTSQNPAFIITNLSRDLIWAATAVAIKEDAAYSKKYRDNLATAFAKAQLPRLVSKFNKGTLDLTNEVEKYFNEFMLNGGETGFTQINTVDDYKKKLDRFVKEAQKGVDVTKRTWRAFWKGVEFLNRSAEDTTRFMVYMTSRQMGRSIAKSIWDAKEVTVNFNKKGSGGMGARFMNFAYIFFNAAIQSLANFGKLMYHHPGKTMAALGVYSGLGMLMPLLNAAMIAAIGGDEEDYWILPDWVRRNNIVIFAPWTDEGFITIPLPHELRPFYGMGEAAYTALVGKQEVGDAISDAILGFSGLLPVDFTGNAGSVAVNFTPTFAQPIAQLMANTDYFGKPIYRNNGFNEKYPNWTKAYKGTNSALVAATEWLNELTGGDDVKKGWIDWNPAQIEHLIESYTGGLGKTINKSLKTISMLWDDDMREWKNVPAISSFYQEADDRTKDRRINEAYFKALDEASQIQHEFNGYRKKITRGNMEYESSLNELTETPEFEKFLIVNEYSKVIKELNGILKDYEEAFTDEQMGEIEAAIRELKKEMLEKVKAVDLINANK